MKCPRCHIVNPNTATSCCKCALRFNNLHRGQFVITVPDDDKLRTGLAIASMVIGILGIFTFGLGFIVAGAGWVIAIIAIPIFGVELIGAAAGLVIGIVARSKASNQPHLYGGKSIAIAGIVTNIVGILIIPVIAIVAAIAIPRRAAHEASAIGSVRQYTRAELGHFNHYKKYASLQELIAAKEIDRSRMSNELDGYRFDLTTTENSFEISAVPVRYPATGVRSFYVTSANSEIIHVADHHGMNATATDPIILARVYRQN